MVIKVLGSGCSKCVTDFAQIARYGIMSTPALVVDDKVVSTGRVLKADQVEAYLK